MNRSLFIRIIKLIQKQDKIDNKVSDALELISDSWIMMNAKNKKYQALNLILAEVMHDKADWIGWWLYEDVQKKIFFDKKLKKKPLDVKTPEQLYDYLVEEYGK